jgi:hypothetical protein
MTHTATLVHITPNAEELISYMARVSNRIWLIKTTLKQVLV